ncbi:hypothetical protein PFISCL1PPCAC_11944, partial [Pristionchus fissidentatus]
YTNSQKIPSLDDFERIKTLGEGGFGKVMLVKHKETDKYYAMKILNKAKTVEKKDVEGPINEKKILQRINFPFLVNMTCSFKDNSNLYMVLEFVSGGMLYFHLERFGRFEEDRARFYAAQVVLALEYLHSIDIIHRDIKSENILIDATGYLKLTDFGVSKRVISKTWTEVGTPEYTAPEMIKGNAYDKAIDWWSTGVLIYEMTTGSYPFEDDETPKLEEKIVAGKVEYPSHCSPQLTNLLENLLQVDPEMRFGSLTNGIADIKNHDWFGWMEWSSLNQRTV